MPALLRPRDFNIARRGGGKAFALGLLGRRRGRLLAWNGTRRRLWGGRASRPEDIPKKLPPEALGHAMREGRFLHGTHAVHVRSLAPGEIPGLPRRADSE